MTRLRFAVWAALACLACSLFVPAEARAKFTVSATEEYYHIQGREPQDIWSQLKRFNIRRGDEQRFAECQYQLRFSYLWGREGTGWVPMDVEVRLDVVRVYPKWHSRGYAEPEVAVAWDKVMALFREHEDGHAAIGLVHANRLSQALESIPPQSTRKGLERLAQAVFDAAMADLKREQQEYDANRTPGDIRMLEGYFQELGVDTRVIY